MLDGLKELREPGQPDPLAELIELFLKDARPRIEKMQTAVDANDLPLVAATTHALKGSASNLGARRLSACCATLEKQAKAGEGHEARETLRDVKAEFEIVEQLLRAELNR